MSQERYNTSGVGGGFGIKRDKERVVEVIGRREFGLGREEVGEVKPETRLPQSQ